jgi:hypothetical protein
LRRYALWLYGSRDYATSDPSLTAPEFLLELSDLYIAAGMLQDEEFANRVMNAMILHLIQRSDKMPLKDFLGTFPADECERLSGPQADGRLDRVAGG